MPISNLELQLMNESKARKAYEAGSDSLGNAAAASIDRTRPSSTAQPAAHNSNAAAACTSNTAQASGDLAAAQPISPQKARIHKSLPEPQYSQHDSELIGRDYSASAATGIRALPDALRPDFRMQLYGALIILGKQRQQALRDQRTAAATGFVANGNTMTVQDLEYATARAQLLSHSTKGQPPMQPVRSVLCCVAVCRT